MFQFRRRAFYFEPLRLRGCSQRRVHGARKALAFAEALESRVLLSANAPIFVNTVQDGGTVAAGQVSLRAAVALANADVGADTIMFAQSLTGRILLTGGVPLTLTDTTGPTTIVGPGVAMLVVSGGKSRFSTTSSAVLAIDAGVTASVSGLLLTAGTGGDGGAVSNAGTLTLTGCLISESDGTRGGGVFNSGQMTVTGCTFSDNEADSGGGIFNLGNLTINNSTFSRNSANNGGGIYNQGALALVNDTLAGNSTGGSGAGGGVFNTSIATVLFLNSTLANNVAQTGGGLAAQPAGSVVLQNTIVAGNTHTDITVATDVNGAVTGSGNLIGDGTGLTGMTNGAQLNQIGTTGSPIDAKLGVLQLNGGAAATMAPLAGSPAIGAGNSAVAAQTDARGLPRGTQPDIGAIQVVSANEQYVAQLYFDLLNRDVDTNGLVFWTEKLDGGATEQSVALAISSSAEYDSNLVGVFYERYLERTVDSSGLNYWVNLMLAGTGAETVRAGIVSSAEYLNDAGGTSDSYVTKIYEDVLGRAPLASDLTYWGQIFAGTGGAMAVATGIIGSLEFRHVIVNVFYTTYLHRAADSTALGDWSAKLQAGMSEPAIIATLVSSAEYVGLNHIG